MQIIPTNQEGTSPHTNLKHGISNIFTESEAVSPVVNYITKLI